MRRAVPIKRLPAMAGGANICTIRAVPFVPFVYYTPQLLF